jgi:hypothetical protein
VTNLEWLDLIYPANVALFTGYLLAKAAYWFIVRRKLVLMPRAMSFWIQALIGLDWALGFNEALIVYLLARSTGVNPPLSIDQYRDSIAVLRAMMGAILFLATAAHVMAIYRFLTIHEGVTTWQIFRQSLFRFFL